MNTEKAPKPGWYSLAVTLGTCILSCLLTLGIALQMNARSAERERKARAEAIRVLDTQRRETDAKWCAIITAFTDTYKKKPPPTETGKAIALKMKELGTSLCR